ncbi:hypothetical protein G3I48_36070 [Streptomyces griseus]|uniref:hypothetical protein n=1 Tax=Streptomyces griseus TaxID=1911 RepID=UPI0013B6E87D|nr:hypothetical protein [Streptomyces griseus]
MTENQSEPQLADQARTSLLEAITKAAQAGRGENARNLAEAYALINPQAPTDVKPVPSPTREALSGRR